MPSKSDIVSFNGTSLPGGVTGILDATSALPTTDPVYQDRQEAGSIFQTATRPPADFIATFKTTTYAQQAAVIAMLDFPRNKTERTLVVYGGDFDAPVLVQTGATVVDLNIDAGQVVATMRVGNAVWEATTPTAVGPTSFDAAGSTSFTVGGEVTANPLVKIGWTEPRSGSVTEMGWKYRRRLTITNDYEQTIANYPIQIGPIDAAALTTASKMRANGWDWDVFNDKGERQRTAVIAPNTGAAFLWFTVESLAGSESRTYDVCYGNPAANASEGFPFYKSYTPAIDISGDNGTAAGAGSGSNAPTGLTTTEDQWVGSTFIVTEGPGIGQYREIESHGSGGSTVFTFTRGLTSALDNTSKYTIVGCGFAADGGNMDSVYATSLFDPAQAWGVNQWIGATVEWYNAATGAVLSTAIVTANTATGLTMADGWVGGTPSANDKYRVWRQNGKWIWRVNRAARAEGSRGRWRLNRSVNGKPSNIWFAVDNCPAAWSITTYNPGDAKNDYNQLRVKSYDVGGGDLDWFALLYASMARKDGARFTEELFGNGVTISIPVGLLGVRHDFKILNPSGICRAVFGCREQGGQDWELYREYSTPQATLTIISTQYYDLTQFGTPLHLLAALTSEDDADIPDDETGTAVLQDGWVLEAYLDTRSLSVTNIATATEDTVYDMALTLRRGDTSQAVGDDVVRVGGTSNHVFLTTDEELWIGDDGNVPLGYRIYGALAETQLSSDSMTDSNGTTLEAHSAAWSLHPDSGAGSATIDGNRVHNTNSAAMHMYSRTVTPAAGDTWAASDFDVAGDFVMRSDNNASWIGLAARIDTVTDTCYFVRYVSNGNVWQLFKVIGGVETQIGSNVAQTLVVDQAYYVVLSGRRSVIRVFVDGVRIIAESDTSITAAGLAGIRMDGAATSTTGMHLDNWALLQGGNAYSRDVPNGVRLYHVEADYTGAVQRQTSSDLLPLSPGSTTIQVDDQDGNIGAVDVGILYDDSYL